MAATNEITIGEEVTGDTPKAATAPHAIDPAAPAGSENSLGAESVRDGRPASQDEVVEAMDEEGPGVSEAA
jgi:hypothetical protein